MEDWTLSTYNSNGTTSSFSTIVRGLDHEDPPPAAVPAVPNEPKPNLPGAMALELV